MKTGTPRTSITDPLQIAEIRAGPGMGKVGLTLCPGKHQAAGLTGCWARDLKLDLDAIVDWNAAVVVTLVEADELERLKVAGLGSAVEDRNIDWLHLPIRDRSVPDAVFETAWIKAGEQLRVRLRSGFNVLVHCMGGLGRAGTIASRLLVELGWSPSEAILAVRKVRPGALETDDQEDFVHGCIVVPERKPETSVKAIRQRAIGALLGLAVGDALGTTLEFSARDTRERVTELVGGGPFRLEPGQWTDDTSMALALADSLLACDGLDEQDLMSRFVSWMDEGAYSSNGRCFDIGITVRGALNRFKASGDPIAGSTDPMSAGNGSLMRLAPVAIRYWDDETARRDAATRQSRTTHGAAEAVDACVAFADVLADAIAGKPRDEVLRSRNDTPYAGAIAGIMAGSWRGKARTEIKSSGYVAHSLEAALWCVGRTGTFEEAVRLAANLGDDADTVAAITGQLAGALYGYPAIPDRWLGKLTNQGMIFGLARQLIDRALRKE
ncbi:ADP-ribosylglycohydrolase family protein [Sphingomonas sp. ASV193]|uniref:ADP-ribosylglycohydrolase family protein n=1 Tax=Sphingomonas sp. ASV193 TaxID=3144405 RepID=UPI0032E860FA